MAKSKTNSKFLNQNQKPNASKSTPQTPSLETPPQDSLPTIPTPIEPQSQQRLPDTTPTTEAPPNDASKPATEPKPEPPIPAEAMQPTNIPLPQSAMMTPSDELPNVNNVINESATSSASPSRTATPATAAYETAGYETPMASRTPSPRSIRPSIGAAVRRTLNIDWPLNLVVNTKNELVPFTHTFQTPSLAPGQGETSTITCASEYGLKGESGIKIILHLGYPATLDLKIFNQFDASRPIFSRFRDTADAPEFHIPWRFLRVLTGPNVHPSILVSLVITTAPPAPTRTSFEYIPPVVFETTAPAAIEALAHFLDQPGGHDVVFCFPDRKHLYADRYVLQRSSPFFRNLFEVRNRESGIVPGVGVGLNGGIGQGKSALADDSDVEMTPTKEIGGNAPRGRSGSSGSSRSRRTSERDITTLAGSTVITPMTSVHGDGVHDQQSVPLSLDTKGFMFQRTASPLMDDNIFVMNINETSFNTFRAFLYYLYTGFISFSPLTSSFQFPDQPNPWSPGKESTLEQRRLEARNTLVGEYMRKYPNRPVPVSPKSIYQVARKYEVPSLEAQALSRINTAIFNPLVATAELFSAFTRVHDSIKQTQIQVVIDNWNEVVKTEDWAIAKEKGKAQPDPYFAGVLCEILEALPPRSGL